MHKLKRVFFDGKCTIFRTRRTNCNSQERFRQKDRQVLTFDGKDDKVARVVNLVVGGPARVAPRVFPPPVLQVQALSTHDHATTTLTHQGKGGRGVSEAPCPGEEETLEHEKHYLLICICSWNREGVRK